MSNFSELALPQLVTYHPKTGPAVVAIAAKVNIGGALDEKKGTDTRHNRLDLRLVTPDKEGTGAMPSAHNVPDQTHAGETEHYYTLCPNPLLNELAELRKEVEALKKAKQSK